MNPLVSTDLFRWDTLRVVGPQSLWYPLNVSGSIVEAELVDRPGTWISAWKPDDGVTYFCHGLTFGGSQAPGGPVSPISSNSIQTIVGASFREIGNESLARPGDIVVWTDPITGVVNHSAIVFDVRIDRIRNCLDLDAEFLSKEGIDPLRIVNLDEMSQTYGGMYKVYLRVRVTPGGVGP